MNEGVSPNCQGIIKTTPLCAAATHNHTNIVDLLLSFGADVNFESGQLLSFSRTPLAVACHYGFLDLAKHLIKKGALVDLRSGVYGNPLHAAIGSNEIEIVELLIENGASIELKAGPYLDTPLCVAAKKNHLAIVKLLILKGAKVKALRKIQRKTIPSEILKYLKTEKYL